MSDAERRALRTTLRRARKALTDAARQQASLAAARHAARTLLMGRARHFGCFLPADGELDTTPLIARIIARGKSVWLPCLGQPTLRFRQYQPGMAMRRGDFGILEPAAGPYATIRQLDVVFMPLVGFDMDGNRLGMGGGYYDRSLAFMRTRPAVPHPRLVGLALALQRVERIESMWWDVPLRAVITEVGLQRCGRRGHE